MKAAVYTRISADQTGEGLGVERQLKECLLLADRLGWEVVARFDDNDLSAFSGKRRPGFEAMLAAMDGGEFGALLCWHTDRLYRSMKDLERLIEIADERKVKINAVQGGDIDLSTSAGRMIARILGSVARQESEHKGERHRLANEQKAAAGKWHSANRPFGYTSDGVPLEPEAAMVRKAVADVLTGKSIRQVAREWNATGVTGTRGTTFNASRIARLLSNPRYAGLRVHRGKVIGPGQWEALIDEDTHRGLVAYLSDPSRIVCTSFERKYIGSHVYRCGKCGGKMRHAVAGGKHPGGRRYECIDYQHVTRRGEELDTYVEMLALARIRASVIPSKLKNGNEIDIAALQTDRAALQARLDELAGLFAEGAIDGSQLRTGSNALRVKLSAIDQVLAEAATVSPVVDLLTAGDALSERWASMTPDLKGKVIDELMVVTIDPAARRGPQKLPDSDDIDALVDGSDIEQLLAQMCVRIEWR
jgi:DNA invertase Pin-like site-specific DNA recombinase